MKVLVSICAVLLFCSLAQASTIYSNIASFTDGSDHAKAFGPLFNSFSTGSLGGELTDLKLMLSTDDPDSTRRLRIVLFADNSGTPGARITRLATVFESSLSFSPEVYDIGLTKNPILDPNTRYWIGLRRGPKTLWGWSEDVSGIGVDSEFFSNTGGLHPNDPDGPYQMAVSISSVAEPDSVIMLIAGLGFSALISRRFAWLAGIQRQ